ncbi:MULTISPECIES: hypothetical protein [Acidobacterium]|nr:MULTISPECIES: hypothetical protein [Acidobacterium]
MNLMVMVGVLTMATSLFPPTARAQTGADQVRTLIAGLSDHAEAPARMLDPSLPATERKSNLHRLSTPNYDLSLIPKGKVVIHGDTASVPVRVHFNDHEGNTLDTTATAHFVRRGDTWYFANFDFLKWPGFLVAVLAVGILLGIAYAAIVLMLWRKLSRGRRLGLNWVKIFFPIFWPALFRQAQ